MNRRDWLRGAALLTAGVVAADQLELVERLGWKRRFFAGADWNQNPYGMTDQHGRRYAASMFRVGPQDSIATLRSGELVTNNIGTVLKWDTKSVAVQWSVTA